MLNRTFFKLALCLAPVLSACGEKPTEQPQVDLTQAFLAQTGGKTFRLGKTSFEIEADRSFRMIGDFAVSDRIGNLEPKYSYGRCLLRMAGSITVEDKDMGSIVGIERHVQLQIKNVALMGATFERRDSINDHSVVCKELADRLGNDRTYSYFLLLSYGSNHIELRRFNLGVNRYDEHPERTMDATLYASTGSTWADIVRKDHNTIFMVQDGQTLDLTNRVFSELDGTFNVPDSDLPATAVVRKGRNEILISFEKCSQSYWLKFEKIYFDNEGLKAKVASEIPMVGYANAGSAPGCQHLGARMQNFSGQTIQLSYDIDSLRRDESKNRFYLRIPENPGFGLSLVR